MGLFYYSHEEEQCWHFHIRAPQSSLKENIQHLRKEMLIARCSGCSSQGKHCSASFGLSLFLLSSLVPQTFPCETNNCRGSIQNWLEWKWDQSPRRQHEHINTAARQPATVKVMLTMCFQSTEFKGWTGISHREHHISKALPVIKQPVPGTERQIPLPAVTFTTSSNLLFLLKIRLNSVHP